MNLAFVDAVLARLCNREVELTKWAGVPDAAALCQLLNELDGLETLGLLGLLPHIEMASGRKGRIAVLGANTARVLIAPKAEADEELCSTTRSALIVAVAVGRRTLTTGGERWPQASALSPTTR